MLSIGIEVVCIGGSDLTSNEDIKGKILNL
jgi:hypothetical protein